MVLISWVLKVQISCRKSSLRDMQQQIATINHWDSHNKWLQSCMLQSQEPRTACRIPQISFLPWRLQPPLLQPSLLVAVYCCCVSFDYSINPINWSLVDQSWLIDHRWIDWLINRSTNHSFIPSFIWLARSCNQDYDIPGRALLVSHTSSCTKWGIRYHLYFSFVPVTNNQFAVKNHVTVWSTYKWKV